MTREKLRRLSAKRSSMDYSEIADSRIFSLNLLSPTFTLLYSSATLFTVGFQDCTWWLKSARRSTPNSKVRKTRWDRKRNSPLLASSSPGIPLRPTKTA